MPMDVPTLSPDAAEAARSGEAAYEALKAEIEARIVRITPGVPLPRADVSQCCLSLLGVLAAVSPEKDAALARFSDAERAANIEPFFAHGRRWALAAFFVASNYAKTPTPESALLALSAKGKPLRKKGFEIVHFLESMGLVDKGTTAKLRAGTGYKDFASDCILTARQIRTHWSTLEPVFQKQPDDKRFTAEHLQTLTEIGDAMTLEVAKAEGLAPIAWRQELLACVERIEALYEPWRRAMFYHFDSLGHPTAHLLHAFVALGRKA
jgi:hypothetical protein